MTSKKSRFSRPASRGRAGDARPGDRRRPSLRAPLSTSRPGGSTRPSLREQLAEPIQPRRRAHPATVQKAVALCAMLAVMLVLLMPALRSYLDQRGQIADLKSQKAQATKHVADLEAQKARWDDPKYVKQQAQQRLGYAMPGQKATIYIDKNDTAHAVGQSPLPKSEALKNHPWYGQVWGSISTKTNIEK